VEILCFSHLRWDFVYQRPQHLLSRFGAIEAVRYWEEPQFEAREIPSLLASVKTAGVTALTPVLPHGLDPLQVVAAQRKLLDAYLYEERLTDYVAWYYTPMAFMFTEHLTPAAIVYDCMDELSAFHGAPPEMIDWEQRLLVMADLVFVGGASLFASKRTQHANAHLFPSSIDFAHFAAARRAQSDPDDQALIPHPRIGFFGVLDERLNRELIRELAAARPEWHFVLIGPVVKIREDQLPRSANLHYLGLKSYAELPRYLANWDVAMLPFAQNASTKFISPTKTPEYLAAGKPVVSTPIQDVIRPYEELGLVRISADANEFAEAISQSLHSPEAGWIERVDEFLHRNSWDQTFEGMRKEIGRVIPRGQPSSATKFRTRLRGADTNV
jgi:glycosyltransferase involved in cell wall biosynthesis